MSKVVASLGIVIVLVLAAFVAGCGSTSTAGATLTVSTEASSTTVSTEASTSTLPSNASSTTAGPTTSTVTTVPTEITTATQTTTTQTTATQTTATTVAGLKAYQAQMNAWYDKYQNNAKFQASMEAISTIQSPLEVTQQDLQIAQDFDAAVQALVGALKKIEPPPQLASVHADYLRAWQAMATGADQMLQALKAGGAPEINEAFLALESSEEQITETQSTLENAVGFPLFSTPAT